MAVGVTVILGPVAPVDQEYVPPAGVPDACIVAELPAQMVGLLAVTVGAGFTTIVWVAVLLPLALVATKVTVYVPAVAYVTVGFVAVEVAGFPP